MASTTQMVRSKETTSNWSSTFPNQMKTQQDSCTLIQELLTVAVSEILYRRAMFPEEAFGNRKIKDLNMKILSEDLNSPAACKVYSWMRGCFQALEMKYIRQLILAFSLEDAKPDEVIESYTFRFAYHDGATSVTCNDEEFMKTTSAPMTMEEIHEATVSLLRATVLLMQNLEPLPDNACFAMKILYYDEVTPEDYEPEGFVSGVNPNCSFVNEPLNVEVGNVSTQHHLMKLRLETDKTQFEYDVDPAKSATVLAEPQVVPAKPPTTTLPMDITNNGKSETIHVDEDEFLSLELITDYILQAQSQERMIQTDNNLGNSIESVMEHLSTGETTRPESPGGKSTVSEASIKSHDGAVRCPCGDDENDGLMVQCVGCRYWQHGVCFCVLNDENLPDEHYGHICGNPEDPRKPPTDFFLNSLESLRQKGLCMWRRTLYHCSEVRSLEEKHLCQILDTDLTLARTLIKRLKKEGFVIPGKGQGKRKRFFYVKRKFLLSRGFPKYLTRRATPIEDHEFYSGKEPSVPLLKAELPSSTKASTIVKTDPPILEKQAEALAEKASLLSVSGEIRPKSKKAKSSKRKQLYSTDPDFKKSQDHYSTRSRALKEEPKAGVAIQGLPM